MSSSINQLCTLRISYLVGDIGSNMILQRMYMYSVIFSFEWTEPLLSINQSEASNTQPRRGWTGSQTVETCGVLCCARYD
uniref:Ovule protein n=1 Tax=Heterorhabditis bacteriophora TaxID=37862 RepID=A0A1I7XU78_HETBA